MAQMSQTYYHAQEWWRLEPRHAPQFDYSKSKIPPKVCIRLEEDTNGVQVLRLSQVTDWNDERSMFRFVDPQQDDVAYARIEPMAARGHVLCVITCEDGEKRIGVTKHVNPGQYNGLEDDKKEKWERREDTLFRMGGWKWFADTWTQELLKDDGGNPSHIDAFGKQYFRWTPKTVKKTAWRCQLPSVLCPNNQRAEGKVMLEDAHPQEEGFKGRSKTEEDLPKVDAAALERTTDDVTISKDRDCEETLFRMVFWDK